MPEGKQLYRNKTSANWELHPIVEGRVVEMETLKADGRDCPTITVDTGERLVVVFKASQLEDLFSMVNVGNDVRIEFLSSKDLGNNKTVRIFDVQLFEGSGGPAQPKQAKRGSRKGR